MHSLATVDLSNNFYMASYCSVNTAFHFMPELMQLYYFMDIRQTAYGRKIVSSSLKANSLTIIQRFTTSSLECYNIYKHVHYSEEKINTKLEKIVPYIADTVITITSFAISYNPFFVIGNIVATDISSKVIFKAIRSSIKINLDLGLSCLGITDNIIDSFTNMYNIYCKRVNNEHSVQTYKSCKIIIDSLSQFSWLVSIDYDSYSDYYSYKIIEQLESQKEQELITSKTLLTERFDDVKAEYIWKYISQPTLNTKYELLKQVAKGSITEHEYNNKLSMLSPSIVNAKSINYSNTALRKPVSGGKWHNFLIRLA